MVTRSASLLKDPAATATAPGDGPRRRRRVHEGAVPRPEHRWSRTFTPSDLDRDLGLYCVAVGRDRGFVTPVRELAPSWHGAVVVEAGDGWFADHHDTGPRTVTAPAVIWLFPGVTCSFGPGRRGWDVRWVLFDGTATRSYRRLRLLPRDEPVQHLPPPGTGEAGRILHEILDLGAEPSAVRTARTAVLLHRLMQTARTAEEQGTSRIVAELRAHACRPLTVPEHARRLEVSVEQLRHEVRAAGYRGPKDLVLRTRMARAKSLLAGSSLAVQAVAREVGYEDPAYFSRLFSRSTGTSPTRFRHTQRAAEPRLAAAGPRPAHGGR